MSDNNSKIISEHCLKLEREIIMLRNSLNQQIELNRKEVENHNVIYKEKTIAELSNNYSDKKQVK